MFYTTKIEKSGRMVSLGYAKAEQIWKLATGTSLRGRIDISYDEIVAQFGAPTLGENGDGKVKAEWVFETTEGVVTIHDYKIDVPVKKNRTWSVGGKKDAAAKIVAALLDVELS